MPAPIRSRIAARWAVASSAGATLVLLLVSPRYGFHRDELYFIVAGDRPDWGYIDQPPLTPLIARVSETLFGLSPTAIRVVPALAIGLSGVVAAAIVRRFRGGEPAQIGAAVATAWSGVALAIGHLLSTVALDYLIWTAAVYFLVRILDGDHPGWWLAVGATVGIGLFNKHLIVAFAVAVLVALLVTRRKLLANPWPWVGAGLAALMGLPNLLWQADNGWPQLEMARALADRSDGPAAFVLQQVGLLSVALAVPAAIGLWSLLRSPDLAPWRPLGLTFVLLFVVFLVSGGKAYYIAPLYPLLLAAGSLWFERLRRGRRRTMAAFGVIGIIVGMFIALPLVPESAVSTVDATGELGETVGWPELVDQVAAVYDSIPEDLQPAVAIFTGSYGEAGAIDVLGPDLGLPSASSGHNTYWLWGPPDRHGPVIGVGPVEPALRLICPDVAVVDSITNPWDVENEAFGYPIMLCMQPARQLSDVWASVRHYN